MITKLECASASVVGVSVSQDGMYISFSWKEPVLGRIESAPASINAAAR